MKAWMFLLGGSAVLLASVVMGVAGAAGAVRGGQPAAAMGPLMGSAMGAMAGWRALRRGRSELRAARRR